MVDHSQVTIEGELISATAYAASMLVVEEARLPLPVIVKKLVPQAVLVERVHVRSDADRLEGDPDEWWTELLTQLIRAKLLSNPKLMELDRQRRRQRP